MLRALSWIALALFPVSPILAQQLTDVSNAVPTTSPVSSFESNPSAEIPALIHFTGALPSSASSPAESWSSGEAVTVHFALYSEAQDQSPLWIETQSILPDKTGHYSVNLGSTTQGLPRTLFFSGQARWLGIQVSGQDEQPRVLLVAVPYAMKAADAETLGGLKASDFQRAKAAATSAGPEPLPATVGAKPAATSTAVTGTGTSGYVPLWNSSSNLVNSALFEKAGFIGIGTTSPAMPLDVNGKSFMRDTMYLVPKGTDPTLSVYGTAFKIDQTGKLTFVAGQLFPGAGTLTGISTAATSGLQGGATTGKPNLSIQPAGVTNLMLQHPSISLPVLSPLAGGGTVALGGTAPAISLKPCPAGQTLVSNGTTWSCAATSSSARVSSVALSAPTSDFKVTGSPITTAGTLGLNWITPPTPADVANSIVKRSASGDITARSITADQNLYVSGYEGIGTSAPIASLNIDLGGTATYDTFIIGNTAKGLELRDTGAAVDIGSLGVPLAINSGNGQTTVLGNNVGIGIYPPQASLNINNGATATNDTFLIGNNTSKGLQMRDTGSGVDLESIGVPLYLNYATQQTTLLNPAGGQVLVGTTDANLGNFYYIDAGFVESGPPLLTVSSKNTGGDYYSAFFSNDVVVGGNFYAHGTKNFRIDHPLDPEHKFLDHAAIESSEVLNQYSGNAILNEKGEAQVVFPDWFSAINTDFRYQLTAVGAPGPNLYVAEEMSGNHFSIAGGTPGMKVSWMVNARRNDDYMRVHPFQLETEKPKPSKAS